ncbi:MAG: GNAT family N-acetyltransferase [Verrucomicrobiales bacterium]|nr:GNAT family N-acetyltransferase [Verrucomicrobiales bacterium]
MYRLSIQTEHEPSPEWEEFVWNHPDSHLEQTSAWGALQTRSGWKAERLLAYDAGQLVGGAQILERRVKRWFKVGFVKRGPLVASATPEIASRLLQEIRAHARRRGLHYVAVVLPYSLPGGADLLQRMGYRRRPEMLPPYRRLMGTAELDLHPTPEALLQGMRTTTRQNIRKGLKRGLKVRLGGVDDLPGFWELMATLCRRRGVLPNIPGGSFLSDLWTSTASRNATHLFIAEWDSQPVAACFIVTAGSRARRWRVGWTGDHADKYPNELLDWTVINWAKENGFTTYDFDGINADLARRILAGEELDPSKICGMSAFKLGYGSTPVPLLDDYCLFTHPLASLAVRFGAFRLLKVQQLRRALLPFAEA